MRAGLKYQLNGCLKNSLGHDASTLHWLERRQRLLTFIYLRRKPSGERCKSLKNFISKISKIFYFDKYIQTKYLINQGSQKGSQKSKMYISLLDTYIILLFTFSPSRFPSLGKIEKRQMVTSFLHFLKTHKILSIFTFI